MTELLLLTKSYHIKKLTKRGVYAAGYLYSVAARRREAPLRELHAAQRVARVTAAAPALVSAGQRALAGFLAELARRLYPAVQHYLVVALWDLLLHLGYWKYTYYF